MGEGGGGAERGGEGLTSSLGTFQSGAGAIFPALYFLFSGEKRRKETDK